MKTEAVVQSDWAIPPGEYLDEVLEDAGLSQADLADRIGRPKQAINEVIKGKKALTADTALQLASVLDVPAHVWTGLEDEYRLAQARQREQEALKQEQEIAREFPFKEIADQGWVEYTRKGVEKVHELCRFFGVSSLANVPNVDVYSAAFRTGAGKTPNPYAVAAWLCGGAQDAERIETADYDADALKRALPAIRKLTLRDNPDDTISALKHLLADAGVALVLRPHFSKTYLAGATFWTDKRHKAVVMMSLRGCWIDIFWFTLCHELGHILLHDKRRTFIDFDKAEQPGTRQQEDEADAFAAKTLIPQRDWNAFAAKGDFSPGSIRQFAQSVEIDPGIVTGRLQHEKRVPQTYHEGRIRWKWKPASTQTR